MAHEILEQLPLAEKVAMWGTLGTIRPHLHFDAAKDAQTFFEVISGEDFDSSWMFSWYQELTGNSVEETMEKHFQGDFREAGLTLVSLLRNTPLYFATRLHSAIKEGHNPRTAVRIMVSRSETDLLSIRGEFKKRYGVSLYSFIEMETQDEYQAALLGLCKAEDL